MLCLYLCDSMQKIQIWIISSGRETVALSQMLPLQSYDVTIFLDSIARPYEQKPFQYTIDRHKKICDFLVAKGCTHIMMEPLMELTLSDYKQDVTVVPLFAKYVEEYCFAHSLIGKIGIVWAGESLDHAQTLIQKLAMSYTLSTNQSAIKAFHQPFAYWKKDVSLRNMLLAWLSRRDYLATNIVKTDCRYLKDANVDTIIPTHYSYFLYQRTLQNYFNQRKQKFHWKQALEKIFHDIFPQDSLSNTSDTMQIYHSWSTKILEDHKQWIWHLSHWNTKKIDWIQVSL